MPSPVLTPRPRHGDVVITHDHRSPACFAVRQIPGVAQLSASTREDALRVARAFARKHGLDLWFSEEGTYRLLEAYRIRTLSGESRVSDAPSREVVAVRRDIALTRTSPVKQSNWSMKHPRTARPRTAAERECRSEGER